MNKHMNLWRGTEKLPVTFEDPFNGLISNFTTVKDHVFISTTTNNLYHGIVCNNDVTEESLSSYKLVLKRAQFEAKDIASNSTNLFIVNPEGQVLKVNPDDLSVVETIVLREEVKCCSHGYKQENNTVKVKSLSVSDEAALYITENGQLWANGSQPELEINSDEPKKVKFFEGRVVSNAACGSNFNCAVVRKIPKLLKDDTDSENELDEEVFVSSCPQCVNNVMPSPMSLTSSDTCPMGLHVQHYSEDHSTNSISCFSSISKDQISPEKTKSQTLQENADTDDEDKEKKNVIFINTEAARQFLTRQLSWVSSSDVNSDKPTRLIKQNVSNMANLVYEGVKTVGDKVVTLSRHMSGSSDINDSKEDNISDNFIEDTLMEEEDDDDDCNKGSTNQGTSLALSLRCEEFPWSSSAGSSERELSQQGLNERINNLVRSGNILLASELWTWGDFKYGQLGTGDTIKRSKPFLVTKLNNVGIRKIHCGLFHTIVLSLDGRAFIWGRNQFNQVTTDANEDQSSPKLFFHFNASNKERAKDIATGDFHSVVMMHAALYFLGKSEKQEKLCQLKIELLEETNPHEIFSSDIYTCCSLINQPLNPVSEDLINDQIFFEEMLTVYQNLIKPFQKKCGSTQESNVYETMCRCYNELMSFVALSVLSLWDYVTNHHVQTYEIFIVSNIEEYITIYKYYLNSICDVISLGGFTHIARIIEIPQTVTNLFLDKIKANDISKKSNSNKLIVAAALQHPLKKLNRYKIMLQNWIRNNGPKMGLERLKEALTKWEQLCDEQEKRQKEAEATKLFWESSGKLMDILRSPQRRLIRDSRTHPLSVFNSGRFSSHWFVLLTDIFIHISGASHVANPLKTLWVEPVADTESLQNAISVTAPEDSLILYTPTPDERDEWLRALQTAIKANLQKVVGHNPPVIRNSSFSFTKHSVFKDAKYTGRWFNGKPHGSGKLEWNDGRIYTGQFYKGAIHGSGKMNIPSQGVYEGQWKDGQQNGFGTMKYANGDYYEGYFKDGLPHGHGIKKEGHFMASIASVYIGEWVAGVKQGYGIMDDIKTGEKYLGSWSNDMKHGCGLIVTLDGIYYEGVFMQDILTGHGVMVFEDGTHYEGDFKSAGIFYGKGTLTFRTGDKLEGNMTGAWNEGVKVVATLHMNKAGGVTAKNSKPASFGKLCVSPDQKWKAIFRQFYQQLGVTELGMNQIGKQNSNAEKSKEVETERLWRNVAATITKSHQKSLEKRKINRDHRNKDAESIDQLDKIPCISKDHLTMESYQEIEKYLTRAFDSSHHPLGALLTEIAAVYTATYGGVRVHPLLLSHAVAELHSITFRIYEIVTLLFPALPRGSKEHVLEERRKKSNGKEDVDGEGKVISAAALLHPILLPRVHSALFVLYALHNKKEDDAYWERLMKWNKQPDITLMAFLGIDQKFWSKNVGFSGDNPLPHREPYFSEAVETLQQLKTTFSPLEKLLVVRNTFEQMTQAVQKELGSSYLWTMDELFPVFSFVVVRASVLQLGSEIHFIEDFMEPYLQNGELGIMFTTLKACYYQILQEKMNVGD